MKKNIIFIISLFLFSNCNKKEPENINYSGTYIIPVKGFASIHEDMSVLYYKDIDTLLTIQITHDNIKNTISSKMYRFNNLDTNYVLDFYNITDENYSLYSTSWKNWSSFTDIKLKGDSIKIYYKEDVVTDGILGFYYEGNGLKQK